MEGLGDILVSLSFGSVFRMAPYYTANSFLVWHATYLKLILYKLKKFFVNLAIKDQILAPSLPEATGHSVQYCIWIENLCNIQLCQTEMLIYWFCFC